MRLSSASLLRDTVKLILAYPLPAIIWLAVMTAPWSAVDIYTNGDPRFSMLLSVITTFAQFQVTSALLRHLGLHHAWAKAGRAASFVGLGIVSGLAIGLGLLCAVLPGLFLYARWIQTSPLVIGEGMRMGEAMQASWDHTAGKVLPVMIALSIVFLPFFGAFATMLFFYPEYGPVPVPAAIIANALLFSAFISAWYLAVAAHVSLAEPEAHSANGLDAPKIA